MADVKESRDVGRKLGLLETMYEYLTKRINTSIYFQSAVLKSNYFFTVEEFTECLKALVNFQPFLRMTVVKEPILPDGKEHYFFRPCDVDISSLLRVRKISPGEELSVIISEEEEFLQRDERFGDGPQWRVVLSMPEEEINFTNAVSDNFEAERIGNKEIQNCYMYHVVFIMQHMLVDAVSSYDMVYRQLIPILNNIINKTLPDNRFMHPLQLTPSYEERFLNIPDSADIQPPWYITLLMDLLRAKNRIVKKSILEPPFKSSGSPFSEAGSGPYTKIIETSLLQKMLKKRKEKGVGVHSILLTAFSFAIIKLFKNHGTYLPKSIKTGWPIDSRKFDENFKFPQPLGLFIGTSGMSELKVPSPLIISYEIFWERAEKIAVQVKKSSTSNSDVLGLKVLSYIIQNLAKVEKPATLFSQIGLETHVVLSNLSKCSPGPDLMKTAPNFVDAEDMYFGICGKGIVDMNLPFFITAVNHKDKIFLANCYNRKWISRDSVQEYMNYVEEMLIMACDDSEDEFEHIELPAAE